MHKGVLRRSDPDQGRQLAYGQNVCALSFGLGCATALYKSSYYYYYYYYLLLMLRRKASEVRIQYYIQAIHSFQLLPITPPYKFHRWCGVPPRLLPPRYQRRRSYALVVFRYTWIWF